MKKYGFKRGFAKRYSAQKPMRKKRPFGKRRCGERSLKTTNDVFMTHGWSL